MTTSRRSSGNGRASSKSAAACVLLELGARLPPLREEGILVLGFMTHSLAVSRRPEIATETTAFDELAIDRLVMGNSIRSVQLT